MLKLLAKIAEKYAKSTNTACIFWGMYHQPKMPASLIKKDSLNTTLTTMNNKMRMVIAI